MTVYKPIYQEAQASVALALYLRAGQTPPSALHQRQTRRPDGHARPVDPADPASRSRPPTWTSTVIKDNFVQRVHTVRRLVRERLHSRGHQLARSGQRTGDGADGAVPAAS